MANDRGGGKGFCNAHDAGTLAIEAELFMAARVSE